MPDVLDTGFVIFVIAPIAYAVLLLVVWTKRTNRWATLLYALLLLYCLAVISVILFPLIIAKDIIVEQRQYAQLSNNFIPLASILQILRAGRSYVILPQIGGNILLAMPLGFLYHSAGNGLEFSKRRWAQAYCSASRSK